MNQNQRVENYSQKSLVDPHPFPIFFQTLTGTTWSDRRGFRIHHNQHPSTTTHTHKTHIHKIWFTPCSNRTILNDTNRPNRNHTKKKLEGPDPECDKKCANKGVCNEDKICICPEGYMGQYCQTALCYPQCMNGGNCTAPGNCSCPPGYQGRHCEGGRWFAWFFL